MIIPDFREIKRFMSHSAKGSTWENHKYIKRIDGTYYYPDSYEGGRHLPDGQKDQSSTTESLSENDVEKLAKEVILGNFGNGQIRKDLLGENYSQVQKRVNELLGVVGVGSKKVEVTNESLKKVEEVVKNISPSNSKIHSGVDMNKVLSVYKNKKVEEQRKSARKKNTISKI